VSEILIAGDWHGNLGFAERVLEVAYRKGIETVYQLGDFGFVWPGKDADLKTLNRTLIRFNQHLFFVDGNHEDFGKLLSIPLTREGGTRQVASRINHLPRGYRWQAGGLKWLALGGATSLDRSRRLEGSSWWPEEELTLGEAYRASEGGKVDIMLTHDAPDGVDIPGLGEYTWPENELIRAENHREKISAVVDAVAPEVLFHGHFHRMYTDMREKSATFVIGLDCDGGIIAENAIIFNPEEMSADPLVAS
jgi:predicted phosphodiesterase